MEFNVEELKSALIEKCKSEGILYGSSRQANQRDHSS